MQIIFSRLFQIFTFKDPNFEENLTNFEETLKIVGPRGDHGARFFQLQGPLALGGARALLSAKWSGGKDF